MQFKLATAAAAVLMSATASQAADLAKKAPVAVDYVKVCDAYGAGFFYIPGTDTCLKIGGYVRAQVIGGSDNETVSGSDYAYYGNYSEARKDANFETLGRFYLSADARSQTEFGVLRSFGAANMTADKSGKANFEVDKAFIQFAGFTAGFAASFWDFFTGYTLQLKYGQDGELDESRNLIAYTLGLGNGLSATISIEDGLKTGRIDNTGSTYYGGNKSPDIIGQLKLTQAWGSAQVSAVAHHQYSSTAIAGSIDEYGYAVLGGIQFNLPMFGAGDSFAIQAAYGKGALAYVNDSIGANKAVYVADFNSSGDSATAWSVYGGFKHVFSPAWTFAIDAAYTDLDQKGIWADLSQWSVAGSLAWTPVTNFTATVGLEYRSTDVSNSSVLDGDGWIAGLRLQRSF